MRNTLVDVTAALAGVVASWVVADLVLAVAERRRPLVAEPRRVGRHFTGNERLAGVYHLGQGGYDALHICYHAVYSRRKTPTTHLMQAAFSCARLAYHIVHAYAVHRAAYEMERRKAA